MSSCCFRFLVFLVVSQGYVWSARNPDVCVVSTTSCGLIPPPLPKNFEFKAEEVDYEHKLISFQEVYFDSTNQRGKFVNIGNGVERHLLFDYSVSQIVQYIYLHPGTPVTRDPLSEICIATGMENSPYKYIFGYRAGNDQTSFSRMFNSYQALRYGDEYQYSAAGVAPLKDRGLRTNLFNSCVYDDSRNGTFITNFYFSDKDTATSGTLASVDQVATVPLQITMNGTMYERANNGTVVLIKHNTQRSISWFKRDPVFGDDIFKIPRGLYCKNFKGSRDFPELPPAFSVDLEVSSFTMDMDGKMMSSEVLLFYKIWYDVKRGIARRDFTPLRERDTEIYSKFGNLGTVTAIYDFNSGVAYIINKKSGRCYDRAINQGEFFVADEDKMHIRMASPEEFLYMKRDTMEYKGKETMRDINCDVWAGQYFNENMNVTSLIETGISTDGWHDEEGEFGIPVRHTVRTNGKDSDGQVIQTVVESNFFRFKSVPPRSLLFDLHNTACIDTIDRKYIGMTLSITADDLETVRSFRTIFLEAVQAYLAEVTMVNTILRIQSMRIEDIDGSTMITFALLEKTKLKTSVPATTLGVDLQTAIANLQDYVDSGRFLVKVTNPLTGQDMAVLAQPNGLVVFRQPIETYAIPKEEEEETEFFDEPTEMSNESDQDSWLEEDPPKTKTKKVKGMSAGGLAGLAIGMLIIGIGVGIAIMYLYIRRYSDRNIEDSYAMQSQR